MRSNANILLVDDNPGDQRLTLEALKDTGFPYHLHIAEDGVKAIDFLRGAKKRYPEGVDLIILDLNLPRMDGREVLREIKAHPIWRHIPVVIVSSLGAFDEDEGWQAFGADGYFTKPMDFDEYFVLIQSLGRFWMKQPA